MPYCTRTHLGFALGLIFLSSMVGCSVFPSTEGSLALQQQVPSGSTAPSENSGKVILEVRPESKSAQTVHVPLSEVTHAQNALERSRSMKKFRRSLVDIYRPTPNGSSLRLSCKINPKTKKIEAGSDYALHPGDYVVVSEDPTTMWDDMLKQVSGPMKILKR